MADDIDLVVPTEEELALAVPVEQELISDESPCTDVGMTAGT